MCVQPFAKSSLAEGAIEATTGYRQGAETGTIEPPFTSRDEPMPDRLPLPWNGRAACLVASIAAFGVALFRPLSTTTEEVEDEAGNLTERTERDVLVSPREGLSTWHCAAWLDDDTDPVGCLNILAFGCSVEVYYRRRMVVPPPTA